jgi:hypothetical protein
MQHQNGSEVVDVGQRRAGHDQVVQRREKPVSVIVGEARFGIETGAPRPDQGIGADERAGVVLGAVDSVGVASERVNAGRAVQRERECEQELGVASAAPAAAHGDRGLAAREQDAGRRGRAAAARRSDRDVRHVAGHLARLSLDRVAQDDRCAGRLSRAQGGCFQGVLRAGDEPGLGTGQTGIARLGRLLRGRFQMGAHRRRRRNAVTLQDRARVGEAGCVRYRWTRGDAGRVVPGHIGDDQRNHPRRGRRRSQAPALDGGEVLAHTVHLRDVRARGEERPVDLLLVLER